MKFQEIKYHPIGVIYSPFRDIKGVPIQSNAAQGIRGKVKIREEFIEGVKDLDGFSHIILVYHFHLSNDYSLRVVPFMDDTLRGVFATRAPKRPNSIGISVVKLLKIEKNILHIENIDIVNGTPLLDIKPFVREFDDLKEYRKGWLTKRIDSLKEIRSDKRFK